MDNRYNGESGTWENQCQWDCTGKAVLETNASRPRVALLCIKLLNQKRNGKKKGFPRSRSIRYSANCFIKHEFYSFLNLKRKLFKLFFFITFENEQGKCIFICTFFFLWSISFYNWPWHIFRLLTIVFSCLSTLVDSLRPYYRSKRWNRTKFSHKCVIFLANFLILCLYFSNLMEQYPKRNY